MLIYIPTEPEPVIKNPNVPPVAQVENPSSGKLENIYKNIENDPLINKIKTLEEKLEVLNGEQSVELDFEEAENPDIKDSIQKLNNEQKKTAKIEILNELLNDFNELLKIPYGSIGYLVRSDPEQIIKLYGVDTDRDFSAMIEGNKIRITSPQNKRFFNVEKMVSAGGGKRWMGEGGVTISDPAETPSNEKSSDEALYEIIASIEKKLSSNDSETD
ncbi:MAG: hypothetical protein M1360_04205 [Candidatus Marsarchaeota archaeon]|jgi:hypothetical protein|nr:hypothetical protein [Candidatus Marsarchaeota archaeon]MCL5419110.1 hypothetical protein [Candidatus Marsarchaeota archaeon]